MLPYCNNDDDSIKWFLLQVAAAHMQVARGMASKWYKVT